MGGCHTSYPATGEGIKAMESDLSDKHVSSIFAEFPVNTDGYAAFLQSYVPGRSWLWWYSVAPIWIDEFDHRLGAPMGAANVSEDGVHSRRFSRGALVSFDTRTNKGAFVWGEGYDL
jgi:hypothetical protein